MKIKLEGIEFDAAMIAFEDGFDAATEGRPRTESEKQKPLLKAHWLAGYDKSKKIETQKSK